MLFCDCLHLLFYLDSGFVPENLRFLRVSCGNLRRFCGFKRLLRKCFGSQLHITLRRDLAVGVTGILRSKRLLTSGCECWPKCLQHVFRPVELCTAHWTLRRHIPALVTHDTGVTFCTEQFTVLLKEFPSVIHVSLPPERNCIRSRDGQTLSIPLRS